MVCTVRLVDDPDLARTPAGRGAGPVPTQTTADECPTGRRRAAVEQCIEEAKGEAGFDQYKVRFWPSWHRHTTLAMMAHAWLASLQATDLQEGDLMSIPLRS